MTRIATLPAGLLLIGLTLGAAPDTGTEEIESLIKQLGDSRFRIRETATARLIAIGKPAVPALRDALRNTDLEVRTRARISLKAIQSSLDYLLDELESGDDAARLEAAAALGELGASAKKAVPALVKLLESKNEKVRSAAAEALTGIEPTHKALEKLIPMQAHVNGKYTKLLRKIHVPQDLQGYNKFSDFGEYGATDYYEHKGIPAGYWVYVYPHWYIWGELKAGPGAAVPAPPIRKE